MREIADWMAIGKGIATTRRRGFQWSHTTQMPPVEVLQLVRWQFVAGSVRPGAASSRGLLFLDLRFGLAKMEVG
jgi:hypothetical protein